MGGFALSEARGVLQVWEDPQLQVRPPAAQLTHTGRGLVSARNTGKCGMALLLSKITSPTRESLFKYRICGLSLLCQLFSHFSCKGFPRREGLRAVRWEGLHSPFLFLALRASALGENPLSVKIREPFVTALP